MHAMYVLEGVALCLKLDLESVIDNQTFFCFVVGLLLTKNWQILSSITYLVVPKFATLGKNIG